MTIERRRLSDTASTASKCGTTAAMEQLGRGHRCSKYMQLQVMADFQPMLDAFLTCATKAEIEEQPKQFKAPRVALAELFVLATPALNQASSGVANAIAILKKPTAVAAAKAQSPRTSVNEDGKPGLGHQLFQVCQTRPKHFQFLCARRHYLCSTVVCKSYCGPQDMSGHSGQCCLASLDTVCR